MMQVICFGSSIIELWVNEDGKETKTVFTGDLGNNDIPLLSSPTMIENADYLVMESTYGSRLHLRNDEKAKIFLDVVSETLDKGGTVVIPSFAVGRTQEILYEINRLKDEHKDDEDFKEKYRTLMKADVFVDSPLAISATEVFRENANLFEPEVQEEIMRGDNPLEFPGLHFTRTADESKALNESDNASIIISASGMCEVGRIKHHLKVKIFGEEIAVNARIEYIEGYSGHADQEGLMNFIYSFITKPKHIFLVHGEPESQDVLKGKIDEETKIPVSIPEFGETYEITSEEVKLTNKIERKVVRTLRDEISQRLTKLKPEIEEMEKYIREDIANENLRDEDIFRINEKIKDLEKQIANVVEG